MSAAGDEYATADTAALDFSDLLDLPDSAFAQYDGVEFNGLVADDVPGFDATGYVHALAILVAYAMSDITHKAICRRAYRETGPYNNRTMAYSQALKSLTTQNSKM